MSLAFIFDLDDTLYQRLDTFTAAFADIFGDGSSLRTRSGEPVCSVAAPLDMKKLFQDFTYFGYTVFEESMFGRMTMRDMYIYRLRKAMEQIGVDISDGEGYISSIGRYWTNAEKSQKCNLCLKAYTEDISFDTED